jgi:hypothetical protein
VRQSIIELQDAQAPMHVHMESAQMATTRHQPLTSQQADNDMESKPITDVGMRALWCFLPSRVGRGAATFTGFTIIQYTIAHLICLPEPHRQPEVILMWYPRVPLITEQLQGAALQ